MKTRFTDSLLTHEDEFSKASAKGMEAKDYLLVEHTMRFDPFADPRLRDDPRGREGGTEAGRKGLVEMPVTCEQTIE
jgi:hypothetical protein